MDTRMVRSIGSAKAIPSAKQRGMSLLELLLVITLLATIVAISWPALTRPLNRSFVQGAAQDLRRELIKARLQAMQEGRLLFFQYQPGSRQFSVALQPKSSTTDPAKPDATDRPPAERETSEADQEVDFRILPEGVRFGRSKPAEEVETDRRRPSDIGESRPDSADDSWSPEGTWSQPLRFFPSGRMDSGKVDILGEDGYAVTVELSGLSGRIRLQAVRRVQSDTEEPATSPDEPAPSDEPPLEDTSGGDE